MKTLLSIVALAGAMTIADTAVGQWAGSNLAFAQRSSACFQNCSNVRQWPAAQCELYCRGKTKKGGKGTTKGM